MVRVKKQKRLAAFGLAEIIVALGIFGSAMVITIALAIGSLRTVKDNELADTANTIMIRSMEYLKSPSSSGIFASALSGTSTRVYAVDGAISSTNITGEVKLKDLTSSGTNTITVDNCSETSPYVVVVSDTPGFLACNQIIIKRNSNNTFELQSIVIYRTSKGFRKSELLGFKNT